MVKDFKIGDFCYKIPDSEEVAKYNPEGERVFIFNGVITGDGYGMLLGWHDCQIRKSTGFRNFMWGGDALDNGSFFSYVAQKGKPSAFMGELELPEYDGELSPAYFIGEEVAVAQSYKDAKYDPFFLISPIGDGKNIMDECGWENKMFVKADFMPHRIKITNIRIERLQDISDEDCLKEGVFKMPYKPPFCLNKDADGYSYEYDKVYNFKHGQRFFAFTEPRTAFAALIDKICGRGIWDNNPYVFVYEFELIR